MLLLGAALLVVVAYDAISTTLSVGAAAGPLTSRLGRGWWRLARRLARRPDSPVIVSTGALVVLLTLGTWLALLWCGWTLVFAADADAVISSTTRDPASGWSRVYFAGFTVFTLGVGDYVPNGQPWEVLTSLAVVTGLGLTTLAITYLVPVVSAVTARRVQANSISGLGSSPQDIVVGAYGERRYAFLDHRLPQICDSILETAERHLSYPVRHYFHKRAATRRPARASLYSGRGHILDEAITILQHGVQADVRPHPAVLESARHAISELIRQATNGPGADEAPAPPDLAPVRAAGLPGVDDEVFAQRLVPLDDHRRRLAGFARESLWPVTEPDRS